MITVLPNVITYAMEKKEEREFVMHRKTPSCLTRSL